MLLGALASCGGPLDDATIREAVLLVGHATAATSTAAINPEARPPSGAAYDPGTMVASFQDTDISRFGLITVYDTLNGTVTVGRTEIAQASVRLSGGPVEELSFGYEEADPLATTWTVRGRANGQRFRIEVSAEDVTRFRRLRL